ncbi:hypothetical protein [Chamaesiphon polymorphus]|jgi:hypothetical protein|uniref:Uncharacterized protein n=1 Tax=Chamaesiphon polymorphus CCALA 037 TaxID=2107692 RepID=A0A2T1GJ51_9CYAN|nr:hypothetical protein [Chamaesiphon polymorphus]PSB57822.1 hypothetical protein C7B77_06980 [Chamaesiphon polymorphus CCALA 037]
MIDSSVVLEILAFCGKGLASAGFKDLYEKWKGLIQSKIGGTSIAKTIEPEKLRDQYEQSPKIWEPSEFFDEIDERHGFRTRKTYRRDPLTGARVIVGIELP